MSRIEARDVEGFVRGGQAAQRAVDEAIAAARVTLDDLAAAVTEIRRAEKRVATQRRRLAEQERLLQAATTAHADLAERYARQGVTT